MPQEITIPRLGWSMEEATFAAWHKREGEPVAAGEPLFALESDKATQDVEALDAGILRLPPGAPAAGDLVRVGQCVGYLLAAGETWPMSATLSPKPECSDLQSKATSPPRVPSASTAGIVATLAPVSIPVGNATPPTAVPVPRISPRALRVATELGLDWRQIAGTGRTGRIREMDVRAVAAKSPRASGPTRVRQMIAERMVSSLRESAPVTLHTTVDATALVDWRKHLKADQQDSVDPLPSYTDLLMLLTAQALGRHPALNARWDGASFATVPQVHMGLAVDTEAGLFVPVIHNIQNLTPHQLCARTRDLIERARTRKLSPDELRGGTFTLTSLGAFGIDAFTPIINPPECAILGVGRIQRRPAVVNDQIVPRDLLTLSLTFDHRVLDGAPAARFLQTLTELIATPHG